MVTRRLKILKNNRQHPIPVVQPTDYTTEPAEAIEPEVVRDDPHFTLYCFDAENDQALFVESDDPEAVESHPFYYQGQNEHCVGLVGMPLETFHALGQTIPQPKKGLIWVHSVGFCGSTLLSKVLDALPSVYSISEPDDLTSLLFVHSTGDTNDAWIENAILSSTRWRCKPHSKPDAEYVAIKTRSEVMVFADSMSKLFPTDKHVFLYRNGVSWMRSAFAPFPADREIFNDELNQLGEDSWARMMPIIREVRTPGKPMNPIQVRTLCWVASMEGYLRLCKADIPHCAARFEDITADPLGALLPILDFCGVEDYDLEEIRMVLGRDSRAGTVFDREERKKNFRVLGDDLVEIVEATIASRPLVGRPDLVLPGTLIPSSTTGR
jgi:hypothetical protein